KPDQGGVLLEADEVVQERRNNAADGLGQDYETKALEARKAEGPGRCFLRWVDGLDTCSIYLGDVGRPHDYEGDEAPHETVGCHARKSQSRNAKAQEVDNEDAWYGSEDVDVNDGPKSEREEHRPGQVAH